MFNVGDLILYGNTGVCEVTDTITQNVADTDQLYYVLKPLYQSCTISTPVNNAKVFMRPIISRAEADQLIDDIPSVPAEVYHNRVSSQLAGHYEESFQSHNCSDLIALTKSLYAKRQFVAEQKRKFSAIDERFMKRAEDLLFGEFAAALEIPKDQVLEYISSRIGSMESTVDAPAS